MTEHAVHLLSGAYAVGALDDFERARFEAHLETCADCRQEVAGLLETTALLAETTAVAPPAHVRDAVLAGIATVRPLPPVIEKTAAGSTPGARRASGRRWFPAVVAAAVLTVVGVGVAVTQPWADDTTSQRQISAADQIIGASDVEMVNLDLEGGGHATVYRSKEHGRAVIVTKDMPAAPDGKVYELWLQRGAEMVAAGLMPDRADQTFVLEGDATDAIGVGITIEPEGGSEEPSLPPVALIELA
ncbi:anti-sigma factor [Nocardioides bigeumensis]|uniref:Regulator of SigK n=1 Tax=Nocardioides bigeumensis TaxID=433657 RepID=A0ABN2YY58_9ACTN